LKTNPLSPAIPHENLFPTAWIRLKQSAINLDDESASRFGGIAQGLGADERTTENRSLARTHAQTNSKP
jgi:hypothetical protein